MRKAACPHPVPNPTPIGHRRRRRRADIDGHRAPADPGRPDIVALQHPDRRASRARRASRGGALIYHDEGREGTLFLKAGDKGGTVLLFAPDDTRPRVERLRRRALGAQVRFAFQRAKLATFYA